MHKKVWISVGDIILVGLRDYQDDKADIIFKYMSDEARLLKAYGELPENIRLNEGIGGLDEEDEGATISDLQDKHGNPPGIIRDEQVDPIPPLLKFMIKRMNPGDSIRVFLSSPQPPVLGGDCGFAVVSWEIDDLSKPRSTAGGGRICFKETASFAGLGQPLRLFGLSRCSLDRPFFLPDLAARSAPSFAQSTSSLAQSSALGTLGWSHYSHDQPVLLLSRSTTCSARSTFSPRGLCCFDTLLT
ncbi:hypothetical protein ZIOFF_064521 [Zingiber officinale]|uniref:S1-like domain-containing protein n=1 Tax=Zingiber officinale TaxID=94328 RepID=A0A8J5EXY8_ZINOF|nr:hypothetical protein ZIOFF_064521 [Zingiber officinale]